MASVETLGALERRINATIPQQQLRGEVEARLIRLGRTAKVHGFRPGKVPLKVLEQQYGAQVHQEVLGDALQRTFAETAQANRLKVAGNPDFEIKNADPDVEEIEFSATFEVYPEVNFGNITQEKIERDIYTLTDADVDHTINTLRKQRAVFETCNRAAQNEDQVRIDFNGTLDGQPFEGGEGRNFNVVLGSGRMLPEFEQAIVGMTAGQTKSFDMTFPDNYHGKDVAGKSVRFTLTVHAIEAPRLPELDAKFAMSVGIEDGDLNRLKAEIRKNLSHEIERRLKVRNKNHAMDALLRTSQLDVPKALLEAESRHIMQQTLRDMKERGVKVPAGMSLPSDLFTERAQRRVKLGLIAGELVKLHGLTPKPEQIKALLKEYAQSFDRPEEVIKWHYSDPSRLQAVENMALEDNIVAWVMNAATVTDKMMDFDELMEKIDNA